MITTLTAFDISDPIDINFITTGGSALSTGHAVNLKLDSFSGTVDVIVNRDWLVYAQMQPPKSYSSKSDIFVLKGFFRMFNYLSN